MNLGIPCDGRFVETQSCNKHDCNSDSSHSSFDSQLDDHHESTPAYASCKLYGGLNLNTFDEADALAEQADLLSGDLYDDFWLLKSEDIRIQGRVKFHKVDGTKQSWLRVIAVGGRFLKNNILKFGTHRVFWNNEEILLSMPSEYRKSLDDAGTALTIKYYSGASVVEDEGKTTTGYEIKLPLGVKLLVNHGLSSNLNVKISLPKTLGNIAGVCASQMVQQRRHMKVPTDETLIGHGHNKFKVTS